MKTMTFRELRARLDEIAATRGGDPDVEVIVRVQDEDGLTMVGGLFALDVDPGCSEIDSLVLDGATDAESRHTQEEFQYGE